jgi:serine/threonine protein phosphatase PrpC
MNQMLQVASRTNIGKRRLVNQDSLKIRVIDSNPESQHGLFLIADGVGGNLPKGEIASQTAVDAMMDHYYQDYPDDSFDDMLERVEQSVQAANENVREQAFAEGVQTIGTTMVGLALAPDGEAVAFNVGDSRIYRVRQGKIRLISEDQLSSSVIPSARRNTKISTYLGQPNRLEPNYYPMDARGGDIYILCTDGLWSKIKEDDLRDVVLNQPIEQAADTLVQMVLDGGAPDNLTLVIVRLGDSTPRTPWRKSRIFAAALLILILLALGVFLYEREISRLLFTLNLSSAYDTPLEDSGG